MNATHQEFEVQIEVPAMSEEHIRALVNITQGDAEATKQLATLLATIQGLSNAARKLIKSFKAERGDEQIGILFMSSVTVGNNSFKGSLTVSSSNLTTAPEVANYARHIWTLMDNSLKRVTRSAQDETPRTAH